MPGPLIYLPLKHPIAAKDGIITQPWLKLEQEILTVLEDTVIGPSSAVNGQIAVFSGTTGKAITPFLGSGVVHTSSGVPTASPVVEADFGFTDITTANASITKHGLLPKLDNNIAHFLNGTGTFTTPAGGGGGNVNGPGSSVIGHLAVWNDTIGETLADGGAVPSGGGGGDEGFAFFMGLI